MVIKELLIKLSSPIGILYHSSVTVGKKISSSIDIIRAYEQFTIHEADIPKTVIITHFGLFEFSCMIISLRHASQTFQKFMNRDYILYSAI